MPVNSGLMNPALLSVLLLAPAQEPSARPDPAREEAPDAAPREVIVVTEKQTPPSS